MCPKASSDWSLVIGHLNKLTFFFNGENMLSPCPNFGFAIDIYIAFTSDFTPVTDFRLQCSTTTFASLHFFY